MKSRYPLQTLEDAFQEDLTARPGLNITQLLGNNVAPAFVNASADWTRGYNAYPQFNLSEQYNELWIAGYVFAYHEHMDAKEAFEAQRGPDSCDAWKKVRDRDLEDQQ